jgi:hypothetical protein
MIKPGDIVKHRKDAVLVRGEVLSLSVTGKSARVIWRKRHNRRLLRDWVANYRLDMLEKWRDRM